MVEKNLTCEICDDSKLYSPQGLAGHKRLKHKTGTASQKVEAGRFLDNEARFLSLLQEYGVASAERVVSFCSSQAEDIYSDLPMLKKALSEQGVPVGKLPAIIKHWASTEGLPMPSKEIGASETTPVPQRFSLVAGRIIPDANGLPYVQCLQELDVRLSNQGKGDDDTKSLLAGIYKKLTDPEGSGLSALKDEIREMREERAKAEQAAVMTSLAGIRADMTALKNEERSKSEFDIMAQAISAADRRLGSIETAIVSRWSAPPGPMQPEKKEELTQAISEQSVAEQELDRLADVVFYGGKGKTESGRVVVAVLPTTYD